MRLNACIVLAALSLSAVTASAGETPRHIVRESTAGRPSPPFSDAVVAGDTIYLAGRLGLDPKTEKAAENPETEVKLIMESMEGTLKPLGLTLDDIVTVTVYCTDLGLYDTFNTAYRSYFHGKYPARAFIGVASLLRGAHFEVQAVAVKSSTRH